MTSNGNAGVKQQPPGVPVRSCILGASHDALPAWQRASSCAWRAGAPGPAVGAVARPRTAEGSCGLTSSCMLPVPVPAGSRLPARHSHQDQAACGAQPRAGHGRRGLCGQPPVRVPGHTRRPRACCCVLSGQVAGGWRHAWQLCMLAARLSCVLSAAATALQRGTPTLASTNTHTHTHTHTHARARASNRSSAWTTSSRAPRITWRTCWASPTLSSSATTWWSPSSWRWTRSTTSPAPRHPSTTSAARFVRVCVCFGGGG
jgi:hypothetical protein